MRTFHLLLVMVLLAVGASAADFRLNFSNATYIAYRTDGRTGTGTMTDPYNGSTADRLDTLLSNAPAGQVICFYPSLNYKTQPMAATNGYPSRWKIKSGQTYIGIGGKDAVKITLATNSVPYWTNFGVSVIGHVGSESDNLTNVTVRGLWLDANFSQFVRHGHTNAAGAGVSFYGNNSTVEDCRVTGIWGNQSTSSEIQKECFAIFVSTYQTNYSSIGDNVVRNCEVSWTNAYPHDYISAITANSGSWGTNVPYFGPNNIRRSVMQGNTVRSEAPGSGSGITAFTLGANSAILDNTVFGLPLAYADTWRVGRVEIARNHAITFGPAIQLSVGTNSPTQVNKWEGIDISDNMLIARTNASPSGPDAIIYFVNSVHTNEWSGFENVKISGNTLIAERPNTNTIHGISGVFRGLTANGNTFIDMNAALFLNTENSSNVVFSGNTVTRGSYGVRVVAAENTVKSSGIRISGNLFDGVRFNDFLGAANDLYISDNIFLNSGRRDVAVGEYYNSASILVTTNTLFLSANQTPMNNVAVVGNSFLVSAPGEFDLNYSVWPAGITNFTFVNNTDQSFLGLKGKNGTEITNANISNIIWSGTRIEGGTNVSSVQTNINTATGIVSYTVNAAAIGGGSESTAAGTNLVLVGTTVSVQNNPTFFGPTATNTTATSIPFTVGNTSTNSAIRVLQNGSEIFRLGTNGNIFTNGTALASGGGGGSVATDTIWDAAGDFAVGTGADTAARLAIGANRTILTSTGTGAAWSNTVGGVTIQLAGMSSNQLVVTGEDGYFTNLVLNADQFVTNPGTASSSPSLVIKSGGIFSNFFLGTTNGASGVPFAGERLPAMLHLIAPTNYTSQATGASAPATNGLFLAGYHNRGASFGTNFYFDSGRDVSANLITNGGRLHLGPLAVQGGSIWLGPLSSTASFGLLGNNAGGSATPHVAGYFMGAPNVIVGAQTTVTPGGLATDGTIWHGLGLRSIGNTVQHVDSGFVSTGTNRITATGGSWTNGAYIQMRQATVSNLVPDNVNFAGFGVTNIGGVAYPAVVTGQTNVIVFRPATNQVSLGTNVVYTAPTGRHGFLYGTYTIASDDVEQVSMQIIVNGITLQSASTISSVNQESKLPCVFIPPGATWVLNFDQGASTTPAADVSSLQVHFP